MCYSIVLFYVLFYYIDPSLLLTPTFSWNYSSSARSGAMLCRGWGKGKGSSSEARCANCGAGGHIAPIARSPSSSARTDHVSNASRSATARSTAGRALRGRCSCCEAMLCASLQTMDSQPTVLTTLCARFGRALFWLRGKVVGVKSCGCEKVVRAETSRVPEQSARVKFERAKDSCGV